jgi:signal transduction histidine kinase
MLIVWGKNDYIFPAEGAAPYGKSDVTLTVQDNGKGMNPLIPRNAQIGHWGLIGMQERAERIGGKFTIKSTVGLGTEVSIVVPNVREGLA